ncbi:MAG: SufD family Fe-S cluster assembly protein [Clostridia bacterium]|nr:SufD family Fe-S cluster assembly protein [Clostridia bacterium]
MNQIDRHLLATIADLHSIPAGAFNIRKDGQSIDRNSTEHIQIIPKKDKPGIDIVFVPGTKNESCHIPVILGASGLKDMVYNDFHIGPDCDVLIVAGCGIHNDGADDTQHDGIHTFYVGRNSHVKYVEKHFGEGSGTGKRVFNPKTVIYLEEGSSIELETVQIGGVSNTLRSTYLEAGKNTEALLTERLMTHGDQTAESNMDVQLNGEGASARIISRSVAKDQSKQVFYPKMTGNAKSFGHVQCDSIIMDGASVRSIPEITANTADAQLIHEAAIGRIAGDQLLKLMTLGLTSEEAEERILTGFLK